MSTLNTLYIVGCGAQKQNQPAFAVDLYTGSHFRAALGHAQRYAKEPLAIRILSAKHGLLYQREFIEPYNTRLQDLNTDERAALVDRVRSSVRRLPAVLRVVMLAGADYASLWREACVGTQMEKIPIREPLKGLGMGYQRQWLANAHLHPVECCDAPLPYMDVISADENRRLTRSLKAAAVWWSSQMLRKSPPPEPSIFAEVLALYLRSEWLKVHATKRGDWPEDLSFIVSYQGAPNSVLEEALRCIGLDPAAWWEREWRDRRLNAYMHISMDCVKVQIGHTEQVIFRS